MIHFLILVLGVIIGRALGDLVLYGWRKYRLDRTEKTR